MDIKFKTKIDDNDIVDILKIIKNVKVFNKGEIKIAKELLLDSKKAPKDQYYRFVTAKINNEMAGYACFAKVDGTDKRYELYWLAVHPKLQGKGIGKAIIAEFEKIVKKEKGKKIIIVTSSKPEYTPARTSYEKSGYVLAATLKDYFSDGDDELFFEKRICQ